MELKKMTIHRGLAELKLIDSKIEKQISEIKPVGINQKGKLILEYIGEEDFKKNAQSKLDSITDLIDRKSKIKAAIVKANGETMVKVGEKEMTIADAINFKAVLTLKKQLIEKFKKEFMFMVGTLNKNNETVQGNLHKLLEFTFGKENVKVDAKDIKAVADPYIEANQWHLFDPLGAEKLIESMEKEVSDFETEVDASLSEINAVTLIEI
jgi:hypothetical protein